jgi:ribosomal protein L11 methyltransferase
MNHIQITITAPEDEQDLLIAALASLDAVGFEQTEKELLVYFEEQNFRSYEVSDLLKARPIQINTVAEKNWNEAWEQEFQPVVVEDFCAIRAQFHPPITGIPFEVIITPKMSFGTGHHATTYMMVEQMKPLNFAGQQVFDFGTGTGILAILAEKMGAASVIAIDNDDWSINNARENIEMNGCSRIDLRKSSDVPPEKLYDIILANINKNVILENLPALKNASAPGGKILLSGLILEDEKEVVDAAARQSLSLLRKKEKNNWISLLMGNE